MIPKGKWMKILLVTPDLARPGGVANYYRVLRRHLDSQVEYFAVGTRNGSETRLARYLRPVQDCRAFYRKVRSGDYDIVHLNPSLYPIPMLRDGLLLLIAKACSRKVLVFFRGWDPGCERWIDSWFRGLFRWTYFRADAFIVLGAQFARWLERLGCRQPIHVETTVVDDEVFTARARGSRPVPAAGTDTHFRILFLARLEKTKGIYEALEALQLLRARVPHVTLTVAGSGRELPAVRRYLKARQLPGVQCVGFVEGRAKTRVFTEADVYFLPTRHGEGMPNAVLEAMAYGLPIVVSPIGGLRDFFQHGKMGYAVDSRRPEDFAEALAALAENAALRARMGQYNRAYARAHFTASRVARRLTGIYDRLAAGGRQQPGEQTRRPMPSTACLGAAGHTLRGGWNDVRQGEENEVSTIR
jgi:glycosyltransferase involved in cell wall biosynthesis